MVYSRRMKEQHIVWERVNMQRALSLKPMKQAAVRRSSSIRKIQQTNVSGVLLSNSAALTEVCHDLKTPIQTP